MNYRTFISVSLILPVIWYGCKENSGATPVKVETAVDSIAPETVKTLPTQMLDSVDYTRRIQALAHTELDAPIIGFTIKDSRGQALFGDNTYLRYSDYPPFCEAGARLEAEFCFLMPILPAGDYSVGVAIANGSQQAHIQHHWVHDAISFKSEASSVATGLIGIPMLHIKLAQTQAMAVA